MFDEKELKLKNDKKKIIVLVCLIISLLIFGISFGLDTLLKENDLLFHIKNILVPITIILGGYIFLINSSSMTVNKKAYLFLIPIGLIIFGSAFLKTSFNNQFLNIFMLPLLSSMFLFSLTNKNYDISKWPLTTAFKLFPKDLFKNLKFLKVENGKNKNQKFLNIFYGLLVGIPIALIIILLLISADKYFGEFILKFITPINNFNINTIGKIINIIIIFFISFSVFINVIKNKALKVESKDLKEINSTLSTTVLSIINFVFFIFIISEISKLTNNFLHLPLEYTYAKYAREGFFQLLLVTAINFLVINYNVHFKKGFEKNKLIKVLLLILIGFSIILIFNSYYRMFLYIGAYGFTTLRMQVILFLLMELILFTIFIKKILEKKQYNYIGLFIIIAIIFYVLNIFMTNSNFLSLLN